MEIMLGSKPLLRPTADDLRLSLILWGRAGSGKTTLAATAPGEKLYVNFDPDGLLSVVSRKDVYQLDLSSDMFTVTQKFKADDPFGIGKMLDTNPQIETVVLDSMTAYSMLGTEQAVSAMSGKNVSLEQPSMAGYAYRNAVTLRAYVCLLRLTKKHKRHFIAITHEGSPVTDDQNRLLHIPPALSESLMNQIGLQTNEMWHVSDLEKGTDRRILVRPGRNRKALKTRMFAASSGPEFIWKYDPETNTGSGIADWFELWKAQKGGKIPLPK